MSATRVRSDSHERETSQVFKMPAAALEFGNLPYSFIADSSTQSLAAMIKTLFFLLLLVQPVFSLSAERFHLVKVVVTGSTRYSQDDLQRATGLKLNSEVTQDDLQNAARRLGGSGAFTGVQFTFMPAKGVRGVEADFVVTDAMQFLPASFENFLWFSDSDLQQIVRQAVPLFDGSVPQSGTMSEDVKAALVQALSSKGLPSQVSYTLSASEMGQISAVSYKVDNAGFKIADFQFVNAGRLPSETLAKALAFLKDQDYSRSVVKQALDGNLVPVCQSHGFLKCAVLGFKASFQQQMVTITADLSEGPQFKLASYQWSGNTLIAGNELNKRITLKLGEPVDFSRLQDDLAQVQKAYGKFGREAAKVKPVPTYNGDQVAYLFQVNEGDLFHMGTVDFLGMDSASAQKLAASWKLAEGQPYDNTYYQRFIASLVMSNPGRQMEWAALEDVDAQHKTVNLKLQLKSR